MICRILGHKPVDLIDDDGKPVVQCQRCGLYSTEWGRPLIGQKMQWALLQGGLAGLTVLFADLTVLDMGLRAIVGTTGAATVSAFGGALGIPAIMKARASDHVAGGGKMVG